MYSGAVCQSSEFYPFWTELLGNWPCVIPFWALLDNLSSPIGGWVGVTKGPLWHHCPSLGYLILRIACQPAPAQFPGSPSDYPSLLPAPVPLSLPLPYMSRVKSITHPQFAPERNKWCSNSNPAKGWEPRCAEAVNAETEPPAEWPSCGKSGNERQALQPGCLDLGSQGGSDLDDRKPGAQPVNLGAMGGCVAEGCSWVGLGGQH